MLYFILFSPTNEGSQMLIEISVPVFKCEEDENVFFSRLYELPNYDSVIGKGLNLYLRLTENPNETVIEELQVICNMWGTTFRVLEE